MQPTTPIILAQPTISRDPVTREKLSPAFHNYRSYAIRRDRAGSEQLFGDIEAGNWSAIFTVRWPSLTVRVNETWILYDEFHTRYDIDSVTQNPRDRTLIDIAARRHDTVSANATIQIPSDPITPAPPAAERILRAGWSVDRVPEASELRTYSETNRIILPDANGDRYLLIWRADDAGGDPTNISLGAFNSRNIFGDAVPLTDEIGVPGVVLVSVFLQNSRLLSGQQVEVS